MNLKLAKGKAGRIVCTVLTALMALSVACYSVNCQSLAVTGGSFVKPEKPAPYIPVSNLHIGDRIVDTSWEWKFKTGNGYTGREKEKPVSWIIAGKNHYPGLEDHVVLLSVEVVALL